MNEYKQALDKIDSSQQKKQEFLSKTIEHKNKLQVSGEIKPQKHFTWNIKRSIFAASTAAVFSLMSIAIIILSVLVVTAGSGQNPLTTTYTLYTDVKLETVTQQHDILIPSWSFFGAPENISVLKDTTTQNDSFINILYRNYGGDEYGGIIRKNETLTFNIVLDSKYEFPEIDFYQNLKKTGINTNFDNNEFRYDTKNNIVYAAFSYKNNSYYLQYNAESCNEDDLAYLIECLYMKYVKVDSVSINLADNSTTIPYSKANCLDINIFPFEATYRNYNFYIDKIVKKDGTHYTGSLSKYAYVDNNNNFYTTKDIEIGAKIYIYAMAETDKIKSNVLEIEIVRIPVDRIEFGDSYLSTTILLGSETIFNLTTYPADASYNYLNDSEVQIEIADESLVTITKINEKQYLVKASNNYNDHLKDVEITVTVDGFTRKFTYRLQTIRVESVELYNSETGQPLEREIALPRNSVLKTTALVTPANAHGIPHYSYTADRHGYGPYVSYNQNGVLTISDDAPLGMKIYISASLSGKASEVYTITVTKVPVESVTITASSLTITPFDEVTMNFNASMVIFQIDIDPDNADVTIIEWKILNVENLPEIYILGNMIFASATAPVGEIIEIQAVVDGVESNIIRVLIV